MKKIFLIFIFMLLFCIQANAEDISDILKEQYKNANISELERKLPNNVRNDLSNIADEKITPENIGKALDFNNIFSFILKNLANVFKKESKIFIFIIIIVIISMLFESLFNSLANKSLENVSNIAIALCLISVIFVSLNDSIKSSADTINQMVVFSKALIPVMCGLMVGTGQPASAAVFNSFLFIACQLCTAISESVLLPLVNVYFALIIADSVIVGVKLNNFTDFLKKMLTWGVGLLFSVFVGIMSLQSILSGAADGIAKRTVKFAVGSMIPVAGGVLGEAMETVFSCANSIKATTGVFGIVVILLIVLVPLLTVFVKYIIFKFSSFVAASLGSEKISLMLSNISSAFAILLSITLGTSILLIVSFSIIISSGVPK